VFRGPSVVLGAESPLRVNRSCLIDLMRAAEQARAPRARDKRAFSNKQKVLSALKPSLRR